MFEDQRRAVLLQKSADIARACKQKGIGAAQVRLFRGVFEEFGYDSPTLREIEFRLERGTA